LILFVGNYFSNQHVDNSSRPAFGEGGAAKATADQLRAIGAVTSNGGTFTFLETHPVRSVANSVAEKPQKNVLAGGGPKRDGRGGGRGAAGACGRKHVFYT
jgi:hypothetical protein